MIIEPPGTRYSYPDRRQVILKCNIQDMSFLFSQLYNALLILVSTVYAVKTRRIPENFNESKFIGFTMYTTCIIWLAFVPIYFGTGNAHETQITTLCVAISLSASVTLVCLYSPKVYIIVFQPDKNIRGKVCMGSTFKKQGSSAGASSMTKCEGLQQYDLSSYVVSAQGKGRERQGSFSRRSPLGETICRAARIDTTRRERPFPFPLLSWKPDNRSLIFPLDSIYIVSFDGA